jgi:hypothetical protein
MAGDGCSCTSGKLSLLDEVNDGRFSGADPNTDGSPAIPAEPKPLKNNPAATKHPATDAANSHALFDPCTFLTFTAPHLFAIHLPS